MKRRRLNKAGKNLVIAIATIVLSIPILCFIYQKSQNEIHIKEQTEQYQIEIYYPILYQKKLDKDIKKYVENKKQEFLNNIKSSDSKSLKIQYQFHKNKNIYHIYLDVLIDNGESGKIKEGKTFYYDTKKKSYLNINDYIKNQTALNQLSILSYYYVMKELEHQQIAYDSEKIFEITSAKVENFEHFRIMNNGLELSFFLPKVPDSNNGLTVKILIPPKEANELLNESYQLETITQEKNVQAKRDLSKYKDKKLIAFTFDDGPSASSTNRLLDGLKKYDAKATFFVLGNRVEQNQEVLKRAYMEGHTIGSHTYSHRNLISINDYERLKEIKETNDIIEQTIGVKPILLRPPYGNINQDVKKLANMHIIEWNLDTMDWKSKDSEKIANEILTNAKDGSIVLLHDIYDFSVDGALLAMEKLKQEGYAFVTIPEMVELKNIELDYTTSYRYFE